MDIHASLTKLSDALNLPLGYQDGLVSGGRTATFSPVVGLNIPLVIEARKVFANETVGVLAHLLGDLYILVSHYERTGVVSAFMLDATKHPGTGGLEGAINKGMTLSSAVSALRPAIVASFVHRDSKWSPLKLPF